MSEKMTSQNELTEIKSVPYNKPLSKHLFITRITISRAAHGFMLPSKTLPDTHKTLYHWKVEAPSLALFGGAELADS
jgi:hypothetical protein